MHTSKMIFILFFIIIQQNLIIQQQDMLKLPENLEEEYNQQLQEQQRKKTENLLQLMPEFIIKNLDTGELQDIRLLQQNFEVPQIQVVWKDFWKNYNQKVEDMWDYAELGHTDKLIELLKMELIDINSKLCQDKAPIHLACKNGHFDIVKLLIYQKADIETSTKLKQTPLHLASIKGSFEICELLIQQNCRVQVQDKFLNTPLHYAVEYNHVRVVELLLKQETCGKEIKNQFNLTPRELCRSVEIFQFFQQDFQTQNYERSLFDYVIYNNSRFDHIQKCLKILHNVKISYQQNQKQKQINRNLTPEDFQFLKLLGKGSFGEVYLVKYQEQLYAMKVLNKQKIETDNLQRYVNDEKHILSQIQNPFLVRLYFAFQTKKQLFLIMEYCEGGDLGQLLTLRKKLSEKETKQYAAELVIAIGYLHSQNILYRDLKPENVVMDSHGHVKLTDFGLSKQIQPNQLQKSFLGSVAYLAPEILLRSGHTFTLDWYLLGLIIYEMLNGLPPFYHPNKQQLFQNIIKMPLTKLKNVSHQCNDLLQGLINKNKYTRLGKHGIKEVQQHPWFDDIDWKEVFRKGEQDQLNTQINIDNKNEKRFNFKDTGRDGNKFDGWTFIGD